MKKTLVLVALLFAAVNLMAEPIGEQRARQIASEFFSQRATRAAGDITLEWAGDNINESSATGNALNSSLMYIYNRGTNGGFVVVAGDSNITPILAYSFDMTLDTNNMAEATKAILDAWCRQVESARKAAKPISGTTMRAATRANDAILYETALWNQEEPYNREAPVYNGARSVTGCVATAMSIICYYHRWPEKGMGTTPEYSYNDYYGIYRTVEANTLGRKYEYDKMLMSYTGSNYTDEQANAVAALMKDLGTSVMMSYHFTQSGAYDSNALCAFANYFSYSKNARLTHGATFSNEVWAEMIRENLRNYGPTYFSGGDVYGGGHAFVVDGFDSSDYFHFNFGWSGLGNGYYLIPSIDFYLRQAAILYLKPDKSGTSTYVDDLRLVTHSNESYNYRGLKSDATSYTTNSTFNCLLGGFANYGVTTFDGQVNLVLCDKDGMWKEVLHTINITALSPGYFSYLPRIITTSITTTIEQGDRLRLYYKGQNSTEWQWARSKDQATIDDELLVIATPKELAKGISFEYDKANGVMTFWSKHATTARVYNADTNELIGSIGIEANNGASYTSNASVIWEFTLGDEPYRITIKQ